MRDEQPMPETTTTSSGGTCDLRQRLGDASSAPSSRRSRDTRSACRPTCSSARSAARDGGDVVHAASPATAPIDDRVGELAGPQRQRAGAMEARGLARQVVHRAQVAVELRAVVLLDDEHAARRRRARRRAAPAARARAGAARSAARATPCAAARATASRTAAVAEPNVITAASPSPSMSAQQRAVVVLRELALRACRAAVAWSRALAAGDAGFGVLEAVGRVDDAGRAGNRHRRDARLGVAVALVVGRVGRGGQALADEARRRRAGR